MLKKIILFLSIVALSVSISYAQNPPRVLFQAFWWDYKNNNYPYGWYNYLTELAPRLKGYGIDAVWVPPCSKGGNHDDDGYGVFDHYDLGDKYQKGDVRTRLGTKDELLRMVAVMHANGIDVIQDIVLNQIGNAGPFDAGNDPVFGKGGKDPNAPQGQLSDEPWKNFRYTSYSHPATDESVNDYLNRSGRWPKNYQNFHRSGGNAWGHNDYNWPYHAELFGPDICFKQDAINTNGAQLNPATYGLSTIYNPAQPTDYMKQQAIQWGVWLKKQTGFDGVRMDAAKHVDFDETKSPAWDVMESFIWNLQHGTGQYGSKHNWADGTDNMFAVSEFIPEAGLSMPAYIDGVQTRSGTFDFPLRDAVYSLVNGNGFFDMSSFPGIQIDAMHRSRTVSFVNNHDDFRPQIDPVTGNYVNFNPESIHPNDARVPAAYAVVSALDGSPAIFFEDLFNIGTNGNRFTHDPKLSDPVNLPSRDKIANIIWARKALNFAGGAYKVRSAEAGAFYDAGSSNTDLLIIERSGNAVIGVNDNGANGQGCWIDTDFPVGTKVKDYSGNTNYSYTIPGPDQRIHVQVPPPSIDAMGNAVGGYVIIGKDNNPVLPPQPSRSTTQEWEMADDLGDSHQMSLQQGGAVPDYGIWLNPRTVGRIFSDAGQNIHLELYPTVTGKFARNIILAICSADGSTWLQSVTGAGTITLDYTPNQVGYYTIKIANGQFNSKGQNVFVKATYTAPSVVNTSLYNMVGGSSAAVKSDPSQATSISASPNPATSSAIVQFTIARDMNAEVSIYDSNSTELSATALTSGFFNAGTYLMELDCSLYKPSVYILRLKGDDGINYFRIAIGKVGER